MADYTLYVHNDGHTVKCEGGGDGSSVVAGTDGKVLETNYGRFGANYYDDDGATMFNAWQYFPKFDSSTVTGAFVSGTFNFNQDGGSYADGSTFTAKLRDKTWSSQTTNNFTSAANLPALTLRGSQVISTGNTTGWKSVALSSYVSSVAWTLIVHSGEYESGSLHRKAVFFSDWQTGNASTYRPYIALTTQNDTTAPTITSSTSINVYGGTGLNHTLTADEAVTFTKNGGTNAALFTIVGSKLHWAAGVSPAPGTYTVVIRATDPSGNYDEEEHTVTVGAALWQPTQLSSLRLAYKADLLSGTDNSALTNWLESTGAAPDVSATYSAVANASNTTVTAQSDNWYRTTKTNGGDSWNGSGYSATAYPGDFLLELRFPENQYFFGGMSWDPLDNHGLANMQYAWYCQAGTMGIYESGAYVGAYGGSNTPGTSRFWIRRTGSSLQYLYGTSLATATVALTRTTSATLYFDSSIYFNNTYFEARISVPAAFGTSATGSPTLQTYEQNGLNVVSFDGGNTYFTVPTAPFAGDTEGTMFVVTKSALDPPTDGNKAGAPVNLGPTNGAVHDSHHVYTNGNGYYGDLTTTRLDNVTIAPAVNAWHIYAIRSKAGRYQLWMDGALIHDRATNTFKVPTSARIGRTVDNYAFEGMVGEFDYLDAYLTDDDLQKTFGSLAWKWNTVSRLDAGHTFKSAPPLNSVTGTLNKTFQPMTAGGTANVHVAGTLNKTFQPMTGTGQAAVRVAGAATLTFQPMTATGQIATRVGGQGSITFQPMTAAGAAAVYVTGQASVTFQPMTSAGSVHVANAGLYGNVTFIPMTATGAAEVRVAGTASLTFQPMVSQGAVEVLIAGTSAANFLPMTSTGQVGVRITVASSVTFQPMISQGEVGVLVAGAANATFAPLTTQATAGVRVRGTAEMTFQPMTLVGHAIIRFPAITPASRRQPGPQHLFSGRRTPAPAALASGRRS